MKEGAAIRFLLVAFPAGLALFGAAALLRTYWSKPEFPVDPHEAQRLEAAAFNRRPVEREHLAKSLQTLGGTIGERHLGKPDGLESAAFWLESTLGGGNIGYLVERHFFEAEGRQLRNLIAELPGRERRGEIVVVGAHYDTVPGSPGANDNGSGIAALLSLARAFAGDPQQRTVRFVAFVNGASTQLPAEARGSHLYARRCQSRGETIAAMLCLDTIGFYSEAEGSQRIPEGLEGLGLPKKGNFLAFVGDEGSRYFADSAKAAFSGAASIPVVGGAFPASVPGVGWSDHWSFSQAGYPAVLVTDTAPYRYPHYHLPTDTVDQVDVAKLEEATRGLEAVVRAWANPER